MVTPPRTAVVLSATFATVAAWAVIAVTLWPVYRNVSFIVLALVAIPVGCALALIAALRRWPAWGVALAALSTFTVIGVPLAVPARTIYAVLPEPAGLRELFVAVVGGWRQLVTIELPVGDYQALLVPALVLLFIGPLITLSVALRARRGELAALVPLAVFVLALALGPEQSGRPFATSLVLAAVLLVWMAVWRRHRRFAAVGAGVDGAVDAGRARSLRRVGVRALSAATALVLLAGGLGVAVTTVLPPVGDRTVLRSVVEQPFTPRDQPSPLAAYRASFDPDIAQSTALIVSGAPEGARIRLATLDSYDGSVFAVGNGQGASDSGRFVRIPTARESAADNNSAAASAAPAVAVSVSITVARSTGVWLPTVGDFTSITIAGDDSANLRDRFVFNPATGTAALIGGVPNDAEYTLTATVPDSLATPLTAVTPGDAAVPAITAVPEALVAWLNDTTAGVEGAGAKLARALDALMSEGYLSHGVEEDEAPSRPGHSLDRLESLFSDRPMVGDAEQYSAAVALIARELGFPSRVVLGFGPLPAQSSIELVERDRTAWVEISTAAHGWMPIDVVPERREIPPTEPDEPTAITPPQSVAPPPVDDPPAVEAPEPAQVEQRNDPTADPFWQAVFAALRVLGVIAAVLALLSSPLVAVIIAKRARRRRRRTTGDTTLRIQAGWRDVVDEARDHGLDVAYAATRTEMAAALKRPQVLVLARVADRATFAPETPTVRDAERVWAAADELRASFASQQNRRQRFRAAVSTRSLRRYPQNSRFSGGRES
jgi:hypothetical protein